MRDYNFGNYITTLRQLREMSQFQLGTLCGVSDKAVSKWENGTAKPRYDTMLKLADALAVNINDLLACDYSVVQVEKKSRRTIVKELLATINERVTEKYGDKPNVLILNRVESELQIIDEQDCHLLYHFLYELTNESIVSSFYYDVLDSRINSSFVAWLLGLSDCNPLPAHYYCPSCKRIELVDNCKCCLDLPDMVCSCGTSMIKDGFDIDEEFMKPYRTCHELRVEEGCIDRVQAIMAKTYADVGKVIKFNVYDNKELSGEAKQTKLMVVPYNHLLEYESDEINIYIMDFLKQINDYEYLSIYSMPRKSVCVSRGDENNYSSELIGPLFEHYVNLYDFADLKNFRVNKSLFKAESFYELIVAAGLMGSVRNDTIAITELLKQDGGGPEVIYCPEELYHYLNAKFKEVYKVDARALASTITNNTMRGRYSLAGKIPETVEKVLLDADVPGLYIEDMKRVQYLKHKSIIVTRMKQKMRSIVAEMEA